jgi:mRNA interferase RelE/StbE
LETYKLFLSDTAKKVLRKIEAREPALYRRVAAAFDDLERDPYQGKILKGELKGRYSYRVGDYRILYVIRRRELIVYVIDVGHRRDVYR